MHARFKEELKAFMGKNDVRLPQVFVKGRLIGGADEIGKMEGEGQLEMILRGIPTIRKDVETKGNLIRPMLEKIRAAIFTDIEDVLNFVDWLDNELSSLADEKAVLKHFNWLERKADVIREAGIEYCDLKRLASEVSSYIDVSNTTCEASLKKIIGLLHNNTQDVLHIAERWAVGFPDALVLHLLLVKTKIEIVHPPSVDPWHVTSEGPDITPRSQRRESRVDKGEGDGGAREAEEIEDGELMKSR
ncbi:hypothetical protein Sjap_001486 [Stephania japonica]|uniref:Glutaredoxin domain-containing protein n=1 Tax=Stephania japonica TaxID=461633 RepID=A0AAP0KK59_9MAGN